MCRVSELFCGQSVFWGTAIAGFYLMAVFGTRPVESAALFPPDTSHVRYRAGEVAYDLPSRSIAIHRINNMWLAVSNGGTFGIGFARAEIDPETGEGAPSCEYPGGSDVTYLYFGSLWAGAVVGRDTLVSVGYEGNYEVNEFWPQPGPDGEIVRRSNMKSSLYYSPEAVSEQDFVCSYTDTFTNPSLTGTDPFDNRPHIPLGLEIKQRTYGWSYDYAADFIMFDYTITNINRYPLKDVYFGIYVDADVYHESNQGGTSWTDDICGYKHVVPSTDIPGFQDTVRMAWTADNDGDPTGDQFGFASATAVTATAVLRTPTRSPQYSFNWWITNSTASFDWGPRRASTSERPYRDFGTGLGTPSGDRLKYYVMASQEFDYDQLESAISHAAQGFLEPPANAVDFADGFDARYLLSFGPFNLLPGDTLPITLAYVAGADFHEKGSDFAEYWDPQSPWLYEQKLDFSDLGLNAKWARRIFDNPGVDTDNNGDSGNFVWKCRAGDSVEYIPSDQPPPGSIDSCEKVYVSGDGVPDFQGAAPPPAPKVKVHPDFSKLRIRWNGQDSETNIDRFSGIRDFEGYRVYYAEDDRLTDYVLLASYDLEDYNLYTWDSIMLRWNVSNVPLSREAIEDQFGVGFDPNQYNTPEHFYGQDKVCYYFVAQDWNTSGLTYPTGIHRVYPDADLKNPADTTEEGYHRYYEYEYTIDNLSPAKPYHVAVTTFDFGSRKNSLSSLESMPTLNAVMAYPLPDADQAEEEGLAVQVFPNPYRIDGGYALAGYENRARTRSAERSRAINFYNLPHTCTIRIFTLAGDLVKRIDHDRPDDSPDAQVEQWDVISRNTQAVVTGIYIYHVSSAMGEQLGKIVIIK